jgi:formate dehydrogenase assembly factor FdhD
MRTPGHDAELAVGFLVTGGFIASRDAERTTIGDLATVSQPENEITVHLARVPWAKPGVGTEASAAPSTRSSAPSGMHSRESSRRFGPPVPPAAARSSRTVHERCI